MKLIQEEVDELNWKRLKSKFDNLDWYLPIVQLPRPISIERLKYLFKAIGWEGHAYREVKEEKPVGIIGIYDRNIRNNTAYIMPVFIAPTEDNRRIEVLEKFCEWAFMERCIRKLKVKLLSSDFMVGEFISIGFTEIGADKDEELVRGKYEDVVTLYGFKEAVLDA